MKTKDQTRKRLLPYAADLGELLVNGKNAEFQTPYLYPIYKKQSKRLFHFFADMGEYVVSGLSRKSAGPEEDDAKGFTYAPANASLAGQLVDNLEQHLKEATQAYRGFTALDTIYPTNDTKVWTVSSLSRL